MLTPEAEFSAAEIEAKRIASIKAETKSRIISIIPGAIESNYREKELTLLMRAARITSVPEADRTVGQNNDLITMQGIVDNLELMIFTGNEAETNGTLLENIVWPVI